MALELARTSCARSSVIGYVAIAQIAIPEVRNGMKASQIRMSTMVCALCAPASSTLKPVAFNRNPPIASAAAMPSFTTHQKI
jgi:hypothetical protein